MTTEQIKGLETINLNHDFIYTKTAFPKDSHGYDGHGTMAYRVKAGRKTYIMEAKRLTYDRHLEITLMPYERKTFSKYGTMLFSLTLKPGKELLIARENFAGLMEWGEWQDKASRAALEFARDTEIIA